MSDVDLVGGIGKLIAIILLLVVLFVLAPAGVWIAATFGVRMPGWVLATAKGFTLVFGTLLALFAVSLYNN